MCLYGFPYKFQGQNPKFWYSTVNDKEMVKKMTPFSSDSFLIYGLEILFIMLPLIFS